VHLLDQPSTYADILYMNGWHEAGTMSGLVAAWSALLELIGPAAVVVDHAPTAALVARLSDIPLVRMGMGFFAPPALQPLPSYRLSGQASASRAQAVEAAVLASVNALAMSCGVQYASLAEAISPDLDLLTCWPELDHYAGIRPKGHHRFVGPERIRTAARPVAWPEHREPRSLAYLSADCAELPQILSALNSAKMDTVAYVGGQGQKLCVAGESGRLIMRSELFDLEPTLAQCDILIGHAANATTSAALAAGKPVLMWPMTAEQQLFAHRVQQTGAGALLEPTLDASAITQQVQSALETGGLAPHARTLAARHANEPDGLTCGVEAILDWLARPRPG
jgi:UDP:flavonoid glycosyltransferase YjiC (YdhE family)